MRGPSYQVLNRRLDAHAPNGILLQKSWTSLFLFKELDYQSRHDLSSSKIALSLLSMGKLL